MKKYLRLFKNHDDYLDFKKTNDFKLPNISHCEQENEVHYSPYISPYNGHAYVDLGLTTGTKWAKMNVGASSETDRGLYFAWGETQGYTASQVGSHKVFRWSDYKFNPIGDGRTFTKYNASDKKTHLELIDDAAHVNWGGDWHMPNRTQCLELLKETKNGYVTSTGAFTQFAWNDSHGYSSPTSTTATISGWNTIGYFFFKKSYTSVTEAISHKDYLFIPNAGYYQNGEFVGVRSYDSGVWASALDSRGVEYAWHLGFGSGRAGFGNDSRYYGLPVRGVVGHKNEAALPYNSIQGGEVTPSNPEVGELS